MYQSYFLFNIFHIFRLCSCFLCMIYIIQNHAPHKKAVKIYTKFNDIHTNIAYRCTWQDHCQKCCNMINPDIQRYCTTLARLSTDTHTIRQTQSVHFHTRNCLQWWLSRLLLTAEVECQYTAIIALRKVTQGTKNFIALTTVTTENVTVSNHEEYGFSGSLAYS